MVSFFKDIRRHWYRHFVSQSLSVIVLSLTYTMALFVILFSVGLKKVVDEWGQVRVASVFVDPASSKVDLQSVVKSLQLSPLTESVEIVSSSEASARFQKKHRQEISGLSVEAEKNLFPISLRLKLTNALASTKDIHNMQAFATDLKDRFPAVVDVLFGQSWLIRYVKMSSFLQSLGLFVGFSMLVGSLFVALGTLSASVHRRKEEIEILETIGATSFKIYGASMINVILITVLSLCVAGVLSSLIFQAIATMVHPVSGVLSSTLFLTDGAWLFLSIGMLMVVTNGIFAYLTIRGIERRSMNSGKSILAIFSRGSW